MGTEPGSSQGDLMNLVNRPIQYSIYIDIVKGNLEEIGSFSLAVT